MQFFVYFDHNRFFNFISVTSKAEKRDSSFAWGQTQKLICSNNSFTLRCISEKHFKVDQHVEPKKDGKKGPC